MNKEIAMQIGIVGGGVAGMFVALHLKDSNHKITILEKNSDTLKKLLITGNGRCNVTNLKSTAEFLENVPRNAKFLHSALNMFSPYDMVDFLEKHGITTKIENNDRVFPTTNKAITIKNCFDNLVDIGDIKLNTQVLSISKENDGFVVETNNGYYKFDAVIVSTGGSSFPMTGSSGDGYRFATNLGITVNSPRGALCGIRLKNIPENFEGFPLNSKLSIKSNGKIICQSCGEFLFTNYGVSGPNVFTLTSKVDKYSLNGDILCFDLLPSLQRDEISSRLKEYMTANPTKFVVHAVASIVNLKLSKLILNSLNIPENKQSAQISKAELSNIVDSLKNYEFEIENFDNIERATITRGGVDIKEINPKTMESKKIENLYFVGEVLDVDGLSGGYNLQIAYSTAFACANHLKSK